MLKKSHPKAAPLDETSQLISELTENCKYSINSMILFLSLSKFKQEPDITILGGFSANFLNIVFTELEYKNKAKNYLLFELFLKSV
jgi:hypothetical protein